MHLTLAGNQKLFCLRLAGVTETKVLIPQPVEGSTDIFLIATRFRLNGKRDHRFNPLHSFVCDRMPFVAQGVAGLRVFEFCNRSNIARMDPRDGYLCFSLEQDDGAEPFGSPL